MTRRRRRTSQRSTVSSLPHLLSRISSLIGSYSCVSWALLLYVPEATTSFSTSKQAVHVPISRRISAPRLALSRAARIPREEDDDYYFDENDDDLDETYYDGFRVSSSSAKFVEWKNTGQRSPQSLTPSSSQERSLPIANRLGLVDPWMVESAVDDEDDENDEEYNSSLQQKRRRSSAAPSQTLADTEAYASDVGRSNYMDDYERSEDDYSTFKEPGNFWSNPVQRPDSGPPVALPSNSKHPTTTRPRPTADPDAQLVPRQRQRSRRATTTFRSGTPPPPKPLADLYHRLFWYGLETDEDLSSSSQEESRTMFGGTKGKFNGLSYLYNGQAVVPPEQRRAVPPRNEQNRPGRAFLSSNEYNDDEYDDGAGPYAYNDDEGYDDDPRQPMSPRKYFSVTPPNDPPRPMWERKNNSYKRRERSAVASWWDDDEVDVNGDIQFDRNGEVIYDQDFVDKSDRTGRRSKRQRTVDNKANWANALESFLGLDRERLRDQAAAYDQRIHKRNSQYRRTRSLDEPQPPPPFRGQQRRNGYLDDERYGEVDEYLGPSSTTNPPPRTQRQPLQQTVPLADTRIIDAEHLMDKDQPSSDTLQASQKVPAASQPPLQSLLTWEERALAVERVPPANVPAWGPTGDLGMDARTKALQDALQDIAAAKQIVEERRHRVTMAQEQMAVLRVDAQIERQRLMKMKNSMRNDMYADERTTLAAAREALRWTQRRIEESSRRLRWRQLQWDEAVEELAHVEARHWALLKAYDPAKAHQVVQDAWQELEQLEPVVARYNEKLKSRQQEQSGGESGPNSPETTASGSSSPSL